MKNVFVILENKECDYDSAGFTHVVAVRFSDEESVKSEVAFLNKNISFDDFYNTEERCSYTYQLVKTEGYQNLHLPSKNLELQEIVFKRDLAWHISNRNWNHHRQGTLEGNESIKNMTLEEYFFQNYEDFEFNTLPIERAKELFREEIAKNGIAPLK